MSRVLIERAAEAAPQGKLFGQSLCALPKKNAHAPNKNCYVAAWFCDNVWTFMLNDVEFREVQEVAKVDKVKIVACDGKNVDDRR